MSKRRNIRFTLLAAVSLDGRITHGSKEGTTWTSAADKRFFQRELDRSDACVMGRNTFDAIVRPLKPRNRIVFSSSPHLLFRRGDAESSRQRSFTKGVSPSSEMGVVAFSSSPKKLLALLQKRHWTRIAIVGGTAIYDWFLKHGLVDEIYLTLEPVIFGEGRPLVSKMLNPFESFKLISVRRLNQKGTLLLHYTY